LTQPDVAAAVRDGEAEIAAKAQLTRKVVMHGFLEAIELARLLADASAMIAGCREIAKMCGFYAPERKQVELMSTEGLALSARLEKMSDAELSNLIALARP
jgi:phage terminase small subunit